MSFSKNELNCLTKLAKLFEAGTMVTTVTTLFDGLKIEDSQKHSICKSLEARGTITLRNQLGRELPYQIEILPSVITERNKAINDNKLERLKSGLLSSWPISFIVIVFIVVAAIFGFIVLVLEFYKINPNQ